MSLHKVIYCKEKSAPLFLISKEEVIVWWKNNGHNYLGSFIICYLACAKQQALPMAYLTNFRDANLILLCRHSGFKSKGLVQRPIGI